MCICIYTYFTNAVIFYPSLILASPMLWNLVYPIRHWYDESYHWLSLIIVRPDNNSLELVSAYSATATDVDPPVNDTTAVFSDPYTNRRSQKSTTVWNLRSSSRTRVGSNATGLSSRTMRQLDQGDTRRQPGPRISTRKSDY